MMRDRRVVQADPADKWQADSDAVQVKPEIEPQNVDFDTFLKTNTGPEQAEDVVISSQSGYRMPALTAEQDALLATAPAEELLSLNFVKGVKDTLHAYQMSKRCNSLRVRGEAVHWAKRGARINSISPGIIVTPLAYDELHGERAEFYQTMLKKMPAGRAGTPDEVAALAALVMGPEGGFITGSDFLIDGGATANFFYGPDAKAS